MSSRVRPKTPPPLMRDCLLVAGTMSAVIPPRRQVAMPRHVNLVATRPSPAEAFAYMGNVTRFIEMVAGPGERV